MGGMCYPLVCKCALIKGTICHIENVYNSPIILLPKVRHCEHVCLTPKETTGFNPQTSTETSGIPKSRGVTKELLCQCGNLCKQDRGCGVQCDTEVQGEGTDTSIGFHLRRHYPVWAGKTLSASYKKTKDGRESKEPYSLFLNLEKKKIFTNKQLKAIRPAWLLLSTQKANFSAYGASSELRDIDI